MPGRPTIWMIVGQGPIALAVGAGGGCLDIFTLRYLFSPLSPSLWEAARYRLKYCLKGPLNPNQPTNQSRKSVVRLNDCPDMTIDAYRGRKTTKQQQFFLFIASGLSVRAYDRPEISSVD